MIKNYALVTVIVIALMGCEKQTTFVDATQKPSCIASQSHCQLDTKAGKLTLTFNTPYLVAEYPFQLFVSLANEQFEIRRGYMEGVDMFMGKIPLFFSQLESSGEDKVNTYTAESMFGSCSESAMTWRIWLELVEKNAEQPVQTVSFTVTSYQSVKMIPAR